MALTKHAGNQFNERTPRWDLAIGVPRSITTAATTKAIICKSIHCVGLRPSSRIDETLGGFLACLTGVYPS